MTQGSLTFGWYLPSYGDTSAYGNPAARIPAGISLFDDVVHTVEKCGFHYILLPVASTCWEATVLASYYAARTERLTMLIAMRAGYTNPVIAAKSFATLDQISGGRVAINLIAGIDDREAASESAPASKAIRYEMMDEEVQVMKLLWSSHEPVAFEGKHFQIQQVIEPKPFQQPHPPFLLGGGSEQGARISARHSDVHLFWGDRPDVIATRISEIRQLAAAYGRKDQIRFGMRMQVILGDTEEEAWKNAWNLIAGAPALVMQDIRGGADVVASIKATSVANRRVWELLDTSGFDHKIHPHIWTGVAKVRIGAGVSIVGTPAQVASTIEEFIAAGCTSFCLSGYPHAHMAQEFAQRVLHPYFGQRLRIAAGGRRGC